MRSWTRTRQRRFLATAGLLTTMVLLAAACGGDNGETGGDNGETDNSGEVASEIDRNAHLRFAVPLQPESLDPHKSFRGISEIFLNQTYDRLVTKVRTPDGDVELAPELATSWTFAEDGLSLEFELRDDVTFHDGTPFNADAVKANIERAKGPESVVTNRLETVQSVEVIDDTHVVFRLSEQDPSIVWTLALGTTGMMISPAAFNNPDLEVKPVGSGPYILVSVEVGGDLVFERFDGYWDKDAALLERLTMTTVADNNARLAGVRVGDFDGVYLLPPQSIQAKQLEADGFHYLDVVSTNLFALKVNTSLPPLDDVRVRRAISMAINRQEISENLFQGLVPPIYQAFPEGIVGHDPSLDEDPFDPEEARRLVQEAGADGATLKVIQSTLKPADEIALVVQQALGDIGLNVELEPVSAAEGGDLWNQGGHHALSGAIFGEVDPTKTVAAEYLDGRNPGTPPAELVDLANEARVLPLGSEERTKAYQEIARYLVENAIHIPIVPATPTVVTRPDVVGTEHLLIDRQGDFNFRGVGKLKQ